MDVELVTVLQIFQVSKRGGVVVSVPDMSGDDGVAVQTWKGRTFQPASTAAQTVFIIVPRKQLLTKSPFSTAQPITWNVR